MNPQAPTFKLAFAVTEVGPDVAAGDYFTALELGAALRKLMRWEVVWLPRDQWYETGDANALIAMTDHYDPTRLGAKAANLVKICWMRNWFDRWAGKPHFNLWDIRLCSSQQAADHIKSTYGFACQVLRIAANHVRFRPRPEEKLYDYVFTGSYWDAPRDIERIDPEAIGLRFALFGKNWENHPQFKKYYKGFAPYHAMPRIYNQSLVLVDDANSVTKQWGSVNSRVFDALASGTLVITNSASASAEAFEGRLPVYDSPEDLREKLTQYLGDDRLYAQTLASLRQRVLERHTYAIRAQELAKIILGRLRAGQAPPQSVPGPAFSRDEPARRRSLLVSIIIPVFNQAHFTEPCLRALFHNTPDVCEVIVVDNGSTDDTARLLERWQGRVRVLRNATNQGFARACNWGAAAASAPYLLFLNNDTEVQPGWLPPLLAMAARPSIGAVGSRLLFPDGSIQHAGVVVVERRGHVSLLPRHAFIGEATELAVPRQATLMQVVTGACMLVNAACFWDAGGFDTAYWNGCEDVDLCFKLAQLDKKVVYEPASVVIHHEGKSGRERSVGIHTNNARLRSRWEGLIAPDLIDVDGQVVPAEGLARRMREGGDLAPDAAYGEAIVAWWKRYRQRFSPAPDARPCLPQGARIAVRVRAPSRKSAFWSDTACGDELARAFARLGYQADVLFKDEWSRGGHDLAIHIRGAYRHYPRPGTKNLLWIISHPQLITKEELDSYDLVLCASTMFMRQIEAITATPCRCLPLAASSACVGGGSARTPESLDLLFVGDNSGPNRRRIVQDVLDAGYGASLRVVGEGWAGRLPESTALEERLPLEDLPRLLGMARIHFNEHPPAMARDGFINHQTFDLGALGLFQISNAVPGIEALGVVTYADPMDLRHKIEYYLNNEAARKEIATCSFERCAGETFDARAKRILTLVAP